MFWIYRYYPDQKATSVPLKEQMVPYIWYLTGQFANKDCFVSAYNFSHRIDHLSFGEEIPGILNPLDGTEKVSADRK